MIRASVPRLLLTVVTMVLSGCGNGHQQIQEPEPVTAAASLASPARLTLTAGGQLLVADASRKGVAVVDPISKTPESWVTVEGVPLAVAELDGEILVGEETGPLLRVQPDGQSLGGFGSVSFASINDLEIDATAGRVFVLDARSQEVQVLDLQGEAIARFGAQQLTHPAGLALDPGGQRVFVSDLGPFSSFSGFRPQIKIYDYQGTALGSLGSGLARPQGMAFADGKLYVVDSLYGVVQSYDAASGVLLGTVGSYGSAPGELMLPLDVVADSAGGLLYVSNNRNARIETFSIGGTP